MPLRLCSILGTLLLAIAVASPVLAEDKGQASEAKSDDKASSKRAKKKSKRKAVDSAKEGDKDESEKADEAKDDDKSEAKKGKKGKGKRKGKGKGKDKDESEDDEAESAEATEAEPAAAPAPEPDSWERPPLDEEKPPAIPAAEPAEEKVVGDGRPIAIGLLAGWGFNTARRNSGLGPDPYGLGFGLRGGYSLDFQLYIGLYVGYYIGNSLTGDSARQNDPTRTTSASYLHTGVEVGYDWWVGPLIVRPSLIVGAAVAFSDNPSLPSNTVTSMMFGPGFTVVHPWDDFFIGGDLRANLVPSNNGVSSVLLAATFGVRFN
jgi:hypothetical protein